LRIEEAYRHLIEYYQERESSAHNISPSTYESLKREYEETVKQKGQLEKQVEEERQRGDRYKLQVQ